MCVHQTNHSGHWPALYHQHLFQTGRKPFLFLSFDSNDITYNDGGKLKSKDPNIIFIFWLKRWWQLVWVSTPKFYFGLSTISHQHLLIIANLSYLIAKDDPNKIGRILDRFARKLWAAGLRCSPHHKCVIEGRKSCRGFNYRWLVSWWPKPWAVIIINSTIPVFVWK